MCTFVNATYEVNGYFWRLGFGTKYPKIYSKYNYSSVHPIISYKWQPKKVDKIITLVIIVWMSSPKIMSTFGMWPNPRNVFKIDLHKNINLATSLKCRCSLEWCTTTNYNQTITKCMYSILANQQWLMRQVIDQIIVRQLTHSQMERVSVTRTWITP